MGYHDRDSALEAGEAMEQTSTVAAVAATSLTALVRTLGFLLLAAGLWAIVTVLFEAVALYRDPAGIDAMVAAIEETAGIGRVATAAGAADDPSPEARGQGIRPAYFLAWFMAVLLFLVIGKLADWVISRGLAMLAFRFPRDPRSTGEH